MRLCKKIQKEKNYGIKRKLSYPGVYLRGKQKKPGIGFLEAVYQEALEIELKKAEIPYEREKPLSIIYDGKPLKQAYRADFRVIR
jgi:hypothetical protein